MKTSKTLVKLSLAAIMIASSQPILASEYHSKIEKTSVPATTSNTTLAASSNDTPMVTRTSVKFRKGPSSSYGELDYLAKGTPVIRKSISGSFSKVVVNGVTGYISTYYLTTKYGVNEQLIRTTSSVNVRSGPSSSYSLMTKLTSGTDLISLGEYKGLWAKVRVNGKTGYVYSKYFQAREPFYRNGILVANKNHPLPPSYVPGSKDDTALSKLNSLKSAYYQQTGRRIYTSSGYRSFSLQEDLFNRYVSQDGYAKASMYSARPGYSEHQTGLAFDVNGSDPDTNIENSFQYTKEYTWLLANAHKFGFILRYPKGMTDVTGYIFEPWHYRYVGVTAATKMKELGLTLEEYLTVK